MQQFSACLGVAAMLVALVTAPLFHSHDHDDHDNTGSLTHAHFLEPAHAEPHHEDEIEAADSHDSARWIDFFTLQIPSAAFVLAIDLSAGIAEPLLEESESIILYSEPRAHSPPGRRRSVPRSPPAI